MFPLQHKYWPCSLPTVQNYILHTLNPHSNFIVLLKVVTAVYTETQEVRNTQYSRTPKTYVTH